MSNLKELPDTLENDEPCKPGYEPPEPEKHPRRAKSSHKQNARKSKKAKP